MLDKNKGPWFEKVVKFAATSIKNSMLSNSCSAVKKTQIIVSVTDNDIGSQTIKQQIKSQTKMRLHVYWLQHLQELSPITS